MFGLLIPPCSALFFFFFFKKCPEEWYLVMLDGDKYFLIDGYS